MTSFLHGRDFCNQSTLIELWQFLLLILSFQYRNNICLNDTNTMLSIVQDAFFCFDCSKIFIESVLSFFQHYFFVFFTGGFLLLLLFLFLFFFVFQ